jgi:hypothetical protein
MIDIYTGWRQIQVEPTREERWKHHREDSRRRQNVHEHIAGLQFLMECALVRVGTYAIWDHLVLLRACGLSGIAESAINRPDDVIFKTAEHYAEEYEIFEKKYPQELHRVMIRPFLLHIEDETRVALLPECARETWKRLCRDSYKEHALLALVKILDCFMYGLECVNDYGITTVLREVIGNTFALANGYAARIPGASQTVWTNDFQKEIVRIAESGIVKP